MRPTGLVAIPLVTLLLAASVGAAAAAQDEPSPGPATAPSPEASAQGQPSNQPPVAVADEATVSAGQAVTVPVLANDTDDGLGRPEGEPPRLDVVAVSGGDGRATHTTTDVTVTTQGSDRGDVVVGYSVSDGEHTGAGQLTVHVTAPTVRSLTLQVDDRPVVLRSHQLTGRLDPATAGVPVAVQRRTRVGWKTFARATTDPAGAYAATFRTAQPGKRVLRARATWPEGSRTRSDRVTVTVRAVADPAVSGPLDRGDVPHSWRVGCPVSPAQLRRIQVNHWTFSGRVKRGTVVARASETRPIVRVLRAAFKHRFPIRRIVPADHFYAGGGRTPTGSDKAAMRAGNTSAFNCRPVTGNPYRVSQHSYGNAIDINTIENPYVTRQAVYPAGSRRYLDRSPYRRGMIVHGGVVADTMRRLGWAWGARWSHPDYQHFSSNGG